MKNNKKYLSRRGFIGAGMAAGATAVSARNTNAQSVSAGSESEHPYNPQTHKRMPTRNLGKTGYQVGILSLGGQATVETDGKLDESIAIVSKAIDLGVNYVDTAAAYGGGVSERHIGEVMKDRRNEVFLASKTHDRSYDGSIQLLEKSLKQLNTDHLDLWQLHNVQRQDQLDQIFSSDGALKALEKAKDQGMVRFLGITGHYEPLVLARALKQYDFDTILMAVNAADAHYLSFKKYLLPLAMDKGIGIIGMKIATRGRMLSCWNPPPPEEQPERMRTPKTGTVTIKEALYYNMTLPVSTNIIGYDNVAQVEENMKLAAEFSPLNEEQMAQLEYKTLPIVRQGLYFRRWDLGA